MRHRIVLVSDRPTLSRPWSKSQSEMLDLDVSGLTSSSAGPPFEGVVPGGRLGPTS